MTDQLPDPRLSKVYRLEATLGQPLDLKERAARQVGEGDRAAPRAAEVAGPRP